MRLAAAALLALAGCRSPQSTAAADHGTKTLEQGDEEKGTRQVASSSASPAEVGALATTSPADDEQRRSAPLVTAPAKPEPAKKEDKGGGSTVRAEPAAPMAATAKSLSGRLSSADVEGVVTGAIDRFARCTNVDIVVEVKALVGGDGKVIEVTVPRSQPDDPRARDCVAASFKQLSFPRAADDKSSPISFELNLRRRPS